jgi:hypothetical protein
MVGIIPYTLWITLLAAGIYQLLGIAAEILYPWCYERGVIASSLVTVSKFVTSTFRKVVAAVFTFVHSIFRRRQS